MTEVIVKEPWQVKKALAKKRERKFYEAQRSRFPWEHAQMKKLNPDSIRHWKMKMRTPPQVKAGARMVA